MGRGTTVKLTDNTSLVDALFQASAREGVLTAAILVRDEIRARAPIESEAEYEEHSAGRSVHRKGKMGRKRRPKPGTLKRSIHWEMSEQEGQGGSAAAGKVEPNASATTAFVGNKKWTYYGMFTEFGTTREPARPFFLPGIEAAKSKAAAAMTDRIARAAEGR